MPAAFRLDARSVATGVAMDVRRDRSHDATIVEITFYIEARGYRPCVVPVRPQARVLFHLQ